MRTSMLVGVKLTGLVLFYLGMLKIPSIVVQFGPPVLWGYVVYAVWPALLSVAAGAILFFKPQIITNRIVFEYKDSRPANEPSFLRTGIILIGVFFLIKNLGSIAWMIWENVPRIIYEPFWVSAYIVLQIYMALIPLYLIFGSERIVRWVLGGKERKESRKLT